MKSKLYTRTGDKGTTSLVGGSRTAKDSPRLEAYGTVDELNSWLGLVACAECLGNEDRQVIQHIQNHLFDIGSALATEPESRWQPTPLGNGPIEELETAIDRLDSKLPAHNRFILPGGTADSARCHVARCVARRAERRIITLSTDTIIDSDIIPYINRLSDYLFVLARTINLNSNIDEIFWEKNC